MVKELYPDLRVWAGFFPEKGQMPGKLIVDENLSWVFVEALKKELERRNLQDYCVFYVNDSSNGLELFSGMKDEQILETSGRYAGSKIITKDKDFRYLPHTVLIYGNGHKESPNVLRSYVFQVMVNVFDGSGGHAYLLRYLA